MSTEAEQILEAAMKLPDDERAELAAILADSIGDHSEAEIEAAWAAEIERRLENLRSGKSKGVPWKEVDRKLRAMLEARHH